VVFHLNIRQTDSVRVKASESQGEVLLVRAVQPNGAETNQPGTPENAPFRVRGKRFVSVVHLL
jgi:hypothetical protein